MPASGWTFALPAGFGAAVRLVDDAPLASTSAPEQPSFAVEADRRAQRRLGHTLHLAERWVLEAQLARQPGAPSRASMASVWWPASGESLYLQVAAEEAGLANAVGVRWWLASGRAVLDVGVRRGRDVPSVEPRVSLQLFEFAR
jgi:hypothetical protein